MNKFNHEYEPPVVGDGLVYGLVKSAVPNGKYLFVADDNYCPYFALVYDDTRVIGAHKCLLREGVPVTFGARFDKKRAGWRAFDVQLVEPLEIDLSGEQSIIEIWLSHFGFAKRECGCEIYVPQKALSSDVTPAVGDRIIHDLVEVEFRDRMGWAASNVYIVN